MQGRRSRLGRCPSRSPPLVPDNSDPLLLLSAEPQLGRGEQTVGNQDIPVDAIVDKLRLAIVADDEERRHFALSDAGRELDIDLPAIVIRIDWPPWRIVAFDSVAVAALLHLRNDRCRWQ